MKPKDDAKDAKEDVFKMGWCTASRREALDIYSWLSHTLSPLRRIREHRVRIVHGCQVVSSHTILAFGHRSTALEGPASAHTDRENLWKEESEQTEPSASGPNKIVGKDV